MKTKLLMTAIGAGLAAVAVLAAAPAGAAITVSQSAYYDYATDVSAFSDAKVFCDFDSACAPGFSFTFAGGAAPGTGIFNGSISGVSAAPPGDTTNYASVLGPDGTATLAIGAPVNGVSFFMGSPDSYNSVSFYSGATLVQSFTGAQFTQPPANGDQSLGERVSFNFNGTAVDSAVFGSTQNSFEFDRVGVSAVPEPAAWSMMIVGFGMAGGMMRAKRRKQIFA